MFHVNHKFKIACTFRKLSFIVACITLYINSTVTVFSINSNIITVLHMNMHNVATRRLLQLPKFFLILRLVNLPKVVFFHFWIIVYLVMYTASRFIYN